MRNFPTGKSLKESLGSFGCFWQSSGQPERFLENRAVFLIPEQGLS